MTHLRSLFLAVAPALMALFTGSRTAWAQEPGNDRVDFARDVLPILSDRCFSCHGPDAQTRKAGLRLDEQRAALAVIRPGRPEASELIRRIHAVDHEVMPPRDSGLTLTPTETAMLARWIREGAEWSRHWAFEARREVAVPPSDSQWIRNPIDAFVLARLAANGRSPNPAAQPAALLRRVTLDLTGVPPTLAELDAFLADSSDGSYERVVDRLLASPRYGERMAWPWLEATRYADTDGYQADPTRTAWPWRDWLVQALNENVPFDRFTILTLAGDLLPNASPEDRLATGLLRNNAHNGEGGRIAAETRVENVFDRTETVGTIWLGLTLECARCHDHKYDPITQRDYYGLFAFFDQTSETGGGRRGGVLQPSMPYLPEAEDRAQLRKLDREIAAVDAELFADDPALDDRQQQWESSLRTRVREERTTRQPAVLGSWQRSRNFPPPRAGVNAMLDHDFGPESRDPGLATQTFTDDPAFRDGEILRLPNGEYATYFRRTIHAASRRNFTVALGSDDAIKVWCNGKLALRRDVRRGVAPNQERVTVPLTRGSNTLLIKIVNTGGAGGAWFDTVDETIADLPAELARMLDQPDSELTPAARRDLRRRFRTSNDPAWGRRAAQRDRLAEQRDTLARRQLPVMVMDQLPRARRRTTRVLERGNYRAPGEAIAANVPSFLPALGSDARDRLALARWLVRPDHPLTARVAVNRAWQTLMGRGLVDTPEDFGRQGDRPTHPDLLDWLADRFARTGWDNKALHRLIVTSSTYRQSAAATPEQFRADPHNRRLARSARPRLPAWMLRDQALFLSGRLVEHLGGPPVRPYQPSGVWAEATFDTIRYRQDSGEALYRRTLYTFWRRIVGPTVLFDSPSRLNCVVERSITNSPLHALTTLNETGFVESARGLAERALRHSNEPGEAAAWMFRAATSRQPSMAERRLLAAQLERSAARFRADSGAARALVTVGDSTPSEITHLTELASLTIVASTILNLDETLTRP
ncbi:MAG: PSD1 and planctomycete cytochrome C domain-containing protein [bacterium]|nr:PSD1 and planctomycete cytochrome C domain-containing protein [bacterium]